MYRTKTPTASRSTFARPVAIDGGVLAMTSGGAPPLARTSSNGSGASFHTAQTHQSSRPPSPAPAQPPAAPGPTTMQRLHDAGITNGRVGAFVAGLSLAGGLAVGIPALTKDDGGGDEKK
jgi:hypothetical protein